MTIFYFALKRSFNKLTNILFYMLIPLICIFLPADEVWPHLPYGYQYYGIIILFVGIRLASMMLEDRQKGIVKRLAVAPIHHFHYLSQNLLAYVIILIIQCLIVVYGGVLYGHELVRPTALLLLFISFGFAALAIALAWISFFRQKDVSFLVYMSLIFLIVILGGLMIPIEIYPDLLQRIAMVFPTYWLAQGLNWVVFGEDLTDFLIIHGVLWLYTFIFVIIGSTRKIQ